MDSVSLDPRVNSLAILCFIVYNGDSVSGPVVFSTLFLEFIMNDFVVLYRNNSMSVLNEPLCFICSAENVDHAEEQCENAYPGCDIVWVVEGNDTEVALNDYYNIQ